MRCAESNELWNSTAKNLKSKRFELYAKGSRTIDNRRKFRIAGLR